MKRREIPFLVCNQLGGLASNTKARRDAPERENYYAQSKNVDPRKRAGYLLRAVCDLWESQGNSRLKKLAWSGQKPKSPKDNETALSKVADHSENVDESATAVNLIVAGTSVCE